MFAAADELDAIDRASCFSFSDEAGKQEVPSQLPRAPLIRALPLTGARWSELTSTIWADLDPEQGTLTLRAETTKTETARVIPLDPILLAELLTLPAVYAAFLGKRPGPGSPIFLSPEGKSWSKGQRNFYRHLRNVFVRAGIPHRDEAGRVVHVHALRHTFATRLARAGIELATAMRLTGHRTAQMLVAVYTHVGTEEARAALEALPRLRTGGKMATPFGSASASGAVDGGRSSNTAPG